MRDPTQLAMRKLEALGRAGLTVSVGYGATPRGLEYYVQVMHDASRERFERPFSGRDFAHCVEIAETEALKRGVAIGASIQELKRVLRPS